MGSRPQDSKAAMVEDAESEDVPAAHRGVHMQNAHQSVVAQSFTNEQSLNFTSHGSSAQPSQSIYASEVKIQGGVTYKTENHFQDLEESTIAKWLSILSPSRFQEKQNENTLIARKGPAGTGKWLLKSQEFINWRDGEARVLWCPGIPGAGKTILASIIINHIHTSVRSVDDKVACIYVYFDYKTQTQIQKRQDLSSLLSSLLGQLVRQGDQLSPEIKTTYKACKGRDTKPTPDEYVRMLKSQIKLFSKVFLVVDALDECLNDLETYTQDEFLKTLRQLPPKAHILFTSRPDNSIEKKVHADARLEIRANPKDLRKYLEHRIQGREVLMGFVNKGAKKDKGFLDKALDAIVDKTQGMFLLAQLHIDFLASTYTLEDFEKGIQNLPQDLDHVYKEALSRIESQDDFRRKLANDVLTWLVFAERPLTIGELIHALSVRVGDKSLNKDRFVPAETWTSACAGIVVLDQGSETIRLAHYTAEKYLRDNESSIFKDAQSNMAETCLIYLSFADFKQVPITQKEVESRKTAYPFYNYAADHWGNHVAVGVRGNTYKLAYEFLSDPPKVMGTFKVMSHYRFQHEVDVTGLHIAAYFGLDKLAKKLLNKGFEMNARTQSDETALHWAAFYGQRRFLKLLVDQGADLNIRDREGRTALHRAVMKEDLPSIEILLSSGKRADVNLEDSRRWTPLRWAAKYGQIAIGDLLLRNGADVDAQDKDGWTALRWAAHRGDKKFVELLIRKGASIEIPSKDQWTLLEWAAREGQDRFIRLLIDKGVNLNAANSNGWTALRWAVEYGCGMAAWLLIQANADVNKVDKEDITPLHSAADKWTESRDKSLIWLLLDNGADITAQTKPGFTALHFAAQRGHSSVVWLLLEKGSKMNAKTKLGLTSLHLAAIHGHSSVVSLLIDRGANVKLVDKNERTALHCAVIEGRESAVLMLIQKVQGLIRAKDDEGRTSLHLAASAGNLPILLMLLNHGAEADALDRKGNTPLHFAVTQHPQLVVCLMSHRADVNISNKKGWTTLHYAASVGNTTMINTLLQSKGIDTRIRNKAGQTPWELAKQNGHIIPMF